MFLCLQLFPFEDGQMRDGARGEKVGQTVGNAAVDGKASDQFGGQRASGNIHLDLQSPVRMVEG
jgi:hypothetical protein